MDIYQKYGNKNSERPELTVTCTSHYVNEKSFNDVLYICSTGFLRGVRFRNVFILPENISTIEYRNDNNSLHINTKQNKVYSVNDSFHLYTVGNELNFKKG